MGGIAAVPRTRPPDETVAPSPAGSRFTRWLAWTAFAVSALLFAFAIIGGARRTPTFAAIPVVVPVWAILLLSVTFGGFCLVGALVVSRMPRNAVGWLFLSIGASVAVTLAGIVYVETGLPGRQWAEWSSQWVSQGPFMLLPFVLLLFPDGTVPARRWRIVGWAGAFNALLFITSAVSPYGGPPYAFDNPVAVAAVMGTPLEGGLAAFFAMPFLFVAATVCFVRRFRSARGQTRQQLKWLSAAVTLVAVSVVVQEATWFVSQATGADVVGFGLVVLIASLTAVPIACGIGILRHRLYDIDVIINRALVYGALTAVLALVYVGTTLAFGGVARQVLLTANNNLAVAGSTLAVAAVFRPARTRIQQAIDRRFFRSNVDAAATLARFSTQIQRDVEISALVQHLGDAVGQTLQPSATALWLRDPVGSRPVQ